MNETINLPNIYFDTISGKIVKAKITNNKILISRIGKNNFYFCSFPMLIPLTLRLKEVKK